MSCTGFFDIIGIILEQLSQGSHASDYNAGPFIHVPHYGSSIVVAKSHTRVV